MDVYSLIKDRTEIAIKNAKLKENYHYKQGKTLYLSQANLSTNVYELVETLILEEKEKI